MSGCHDTPEGGCHTGADDDDYRTPPTKDITISALRDALKQTRDALAKVEHRHSYGGPGYEDQEGTECVWCFDPEPNHKSDCPRQAAIAAANALLDKE